MQGNPALQSELGVSPGDGPPPTWMLPFDDSYIFIRYAQQLYRGDPLEWNTGEPSSGASSFLYPWLLLPGQWLSAEVAGWSWWSRAIGIAALWLLGLAVVQIARQLGLTGPWPLACGLAVVWSGPVGLGALAGMESALNAAALLLASTLWLRARQDGSRLTRIALAVLLALLPLVRPENLLLTLIAAVAVLFLPSRPLPRWTVPMLVLPGAGVALLNLVLTGLAQPTAVVTKSWLGIAYPDLLTLLKLYLLGLWTEIVPVYLGLRGFLLWPPVGLLAAATTVTALWLATRRKTAAGPADDDGDAAAFGLLPVALVWSVLVALAPMSSMPTWQGMRHHHAGLVLAWVLAFAGTYHLVRRYRQPRPLLGRVCDVLIWLPALFLMTFLPTWGGLHAQKSIEIHHRHGPASAWLAEHAGNQVLLLNDAGILSLAHDGPAIDLMGLGTPSFARAYRHGAGAMVEELARQRPLPTLAAANLDVFRLGELLDKPILEGLDPGDQTIVAAVDLDLLAHTELTTPGIDFAHLSSEAQARLRWHPAPDPYIASLALDLADEEGVARLQGCRPIRGKLEVEIPPRISTVRGSLAAPASQSSGVRLSFDSGDTELDQPLIHGSWQGVEVTVPPGARWLYLEAPPATPSPCIESLRFD